MNELILTWINLVAPLIIWYELDIRVVYAIIQLESGGDPKAISSSGAVGLMQVMPREAGPMFGDRPTRADLLDPAINVTYGCKILKAGIDAFSGDLQRGICAYYMGAAGVRKRGLDSADAQEYLAAFRRVWQKLYGERLLPWEN